MPRRPTEFGRQEGLHQVPGHRRSHGPASNADYVHVIVLDSLPGGEVVVNQGGADARNLIGADRGADAAAADCYPSFHLTGGYGPGKGDDEIGIVVAGVQTMGTEIYHLMACGLELGHQFLF